MGLRDLGFTVGCRIWGLVLGLLHPMMEYQMEKMKGKWKQGLLGASELEGMVGCINIGPKCNDPY